MVWYETFFKYIIYIFYILYVIILLGLSKSAPEYLHLLRDILKYFICAILILRFNPLSSHKFTKFDKELVFQCAVYLLSTTTLTEYVLSNLNTFDKYAKQRI